MMKRAVLVFLACLFLFTGHVKAEEITTFTAPQLETQIHEEDKAVSLYNLTDFKDTQKDDKPKHQVGNKSPLYMYTSYLDTDNPIKTVTNNMIQGVFYFAKLIYSLVDWVGGLLDKFNVINTYSTKMFANGKKIYTDFFKVNNPILYLIALGVLWLLIKAFFKGNLPQTMGAIALILVFNISYFTLGTKVLEQVDTQSNNIVTYIVSQIKIEGAPTKEEDAFDVMVANPFKAMNFEKESEYGQNNKNVNDLLNSDNDSGKVEAIRKESGSEYLTGNLFGSKFTVALGAVVNNLVFGFVILVFKVCVVVVKTLLLVLFTIAPFVAFVSFFEFSQMAMKNLIGKSLGLAVIGTVLGGGTSLFITLNNVLDASLGGADANPLFLAVMKIIIYVLLWKNKNLIASIFKANLSRLGNNRVVQGMNRAFGQAKQKALAPVQQFAMAGGYTAGQGLKGLDAKVGRTALRNHGNQKRLGKYEANISDFADPTLEDKKRRKAEKQTARFEKRLNKNEKKAENPHLSKGKKAKLEQEKKINKPALDAQRQKPVTPAGKDLKNLKDKGELAKRVQASAERFKKNTEGIYEKGQKREGIADVNQKIMDKTKAELAQKKQKEEVVSRFVANRQAQTREKLKAERQKVQMDNTQKRTFKKEGVEKGKKDAQRMQKHPLEDIPALNPFEERSHE